MYIVLYCISNLNHTCTIKALLSLFNFRPQEGGLIAGHCRQKGIQAGIVDTNTRSEETRETSSDIHRHPETLTNATSFIPCVKRLSHTSLDCKLVPVQHREYE